MGSEYFSTLEIDAIGEILNISLGASATAVSTLLNSRVDITTPIVKVVSRDEFEIEKTDPAVGVEITYVSGLEGENVMLLKRHDVKVILELLMGMEMSDDEFELNEINISAVCEVMNQMMGASSTALSEFLGRMVNISTPISFEVKSKEEFLDKYFGDDTPKVVVGFTLKIADRLESEFFNVMPMELAKELVRGFLPEEAIIDLNSPNKKGDEKKQEEPKEAAPAAPVAPAPAAESSPSPSGGKMSQEEIEKLLQGGADETPVAPAPAAESNPSPSGGKMSQEEIEKLLQGGMDTAPAQPTIAPAPAESVQPTAAPVAPVQAAVGADVAMMQMQMMQQMMQQMQQMQQSQQQMLEESRKPEPKMLNVQPPVRPNLKQSKDIALQGEQEENMELILGVPLEISVEIGRTRKYVKDILDFTKGSLVVLDKLAGEQVDLYVNGQCIAKGDVVVVEDNFGIRITEIMKINFTSLE